MPQSEPRRRLKSKLDPYAAYLQERWDAGHRETKQLWEEISVQGYRGSVRPLVQWTQLRRERERGRRQNASQHQTTMTSGLPTSSTEHTNGVPTVERLPGTRQLAWFVFLGTPGLNETEQQTLQRVRKHPEVAQAYTLTQQFRRIVRDREPSKLDGWLEACQTSDIGERASFAAGLRREEAIVRAALEHRYSNGPVEGNVTRLKQIRRAMYGRGKLDLLRARVLAAA